MKTCGSFQAGTSSTSFAASCAVRCWMACCDRCCSCAFAPVNRGEYLIDLALAALVVLLKCCPLARISHAQGVPIDRLVFLEQFLGGCLCQRVNLLQTLLRKLMNFLHACFCGLRCLSDSACLVVDVPLKLVGPQQVLSLAVPSVPSILVLTLMVPSSSTSTESASIPRYFATSAVVICGPRPAARHRGQAQRVFLLLVQALAWLRPHGTVPVPLPWVLACPQQPGNAGFVLAYCRPGGRVLLVAQSCSPAVVSRRCALPQNKKAPESAYITEGCFRAIS